MQFVLFLVFAVEDAIVQFSAAVTDPPPSPPIVPLWNLKPKQIHSSIVAFGCGVVFHHSNRKKLMCALWQGPLGTTHTALWLCAACVLCLPVTTCCLFGTLCTGLFLHPLHQGLLGCTVMTAMGLSGAFSMQIWVSEHTGGSKMNDRTSTDTMTLELCWSTQYLPRCRNTHVGCCLFCDGHLFPHPHSTLAV